MFKLIYQCDTILYPIYLLYNVKQIVSSTYNCYILETLIYFKLPKITTPILLGFMHFGLGLGFGKYIYISVILILTQDSCGSLKRSSNKYIIFMPAILNNSNRQIYPYIKFPMGMMLHEVGFKAKNCCTEH